MNQPRPIPFEERRRILDELMTGASEKARGFLAVVGAAGYAGRAMTCVRVPGIPYSANRTQQNAAAKNKQISD